MFSSAALLSFASVALAATQNYNFVVGNANVAPDGFSRSATLVNGQFPGPVITANKGDTIMVNVQNSLTDPSMRRSTSIHWHGLHQHRLAYDDGTSFITQCPISPSNSYTYQINPAEQTGTYWYHSHLSTQYVDGLRGALIIYDPNDPYKSMYDVDDNSTIIFLSDWYHRTAPALKAAWFSGQLSEPVPDTSLLNGAGRYIGGPKVNRARVNVVQGKRYRFRIINSNVIVQDEFMIQGHNMTVIEADGILSKPYTVDSMPILPGQRYSVVVYANQPVANYWIKYNSTDPNPGIVLPRDNPNFNGSDSWAVLHYQGAPNAEPTTPMPLGLPKGGVEFEEYKLQPYANPTPPGGSGPADYNVKYIYSPKNASGTTWFMNGSSTFVSPSVPILQSILAGATNPSDFAPSELVTVVGPNKTVEVTLIGGSGHPFHLHGHDMWVIQSATGPKNYVNPPQRDTIASSLAGGPLGNGTIIFRFKTDNPGPWFLHCHIDWHLETGLAAVFVEDPAGERSGSNSVQPNQAWDSLCNTYNALPPSEQ